MANNYQQFSEQILHLTTEERAWVRRVLTTDDVPTTIKATLKENGVDSEAK